MLCCLIYLYFPEHLKTLTIALIFKSIISKQRLHGQWGRKCLKPERIYASCLTPGVTNSVWDCGRIVEDIHLDCPNISSTCLSLGNNGEIFNQVKVFYFLVFQSLDGESFLLGFFKVWLVNHCKKFPMNMKCIAEYFRKFK